MTKSIFFSWQSDIPPRVCRNFLKGILEEVCADIASDTGVNEALRDVGVDSDTQGVAGQPPIVETIFKKIDASAVFVADMTFVGVRGDSRPTPNPNVLIEYGWALKGLKHERVICVMNTAYGEPSNDNLPFDLSHVRWPIRYNLSENATAEFKAREKRKLVITLNDAIRASLATMPSATTELPYKFSAAKTKDGPARFRDQGEALGFDNDPPFGSNKETFLYPGPAIWLRLMPVIDLKKQWPPHELKNCAVQNNKMNLAPLLNGAGGYSLLRAEDGIGMFRAASKSEQNPQSKSTLVDSIAFAFETGEVWSIDTALLKWDTNTIPFVEQYYIEGIQNYARFLQSIGIQPPYRWIAGMTGLKGRHLSIPDQPGYRHLGAGPLCAADTIEVDGQYDGKQSAASALLPFFNKIFYQCGMDRPDYLAK